MLGQFLASSSFEKNKQFVQFGASPCCRGVVAGTNVANVKPANVGGRRGTWHGGDVSAVVRSEERDPYLSTETKPLHVLYRTNVGIILHVHVECTLEE